MNNDLMFSSASDEWETPNDLFTRLHSEFKFQIDLAASATNTKLPIYSSDSLETRWCVSGFERGWCNPPYSRGLQGKFIAKAAAERRRGFLAVMLLPARTDTKAFHAHIYDEKRWRARRGVSIRFLRGRLKFSGAKNAAPFPSMLVIFKP